MNLEYIKYEKYNIDLKNIFKNSKTKYINREGLIIHIKSNQFRINGFVEQLGAKNMHVLDGGIQKLIEENYQLYKK